MKADQITKLVLAGGGDRARQVLKKLSLKDRLPLLAELVPLAKVEPKLLEFLRANFVIEIGALAQSAWDVEAAEKLYNKTLYSVVK